MNYQIYYQIFECVSVIFETFIVYQYISGLFRKRDEEKTSTLWYIIFCTGLMLLSLFMHTGVILTGYTLIVMYMLTAYIYKASISSRIFAAVYFSAIMIGAEIFTSGLVSGIWGLDLSEALEYGLPRVLSILVAKLIQIFLVKASVSVVNWKTKKSAKDEFKAMLPLLLCQIFSIILAHSVFTISGLVFDGFTAVALFAMVGLIYMNIIIFWYFDRIKVAYDLKTKNEAAKLKLNLQKQYHEVLREHQQETDALWHDMKMHINLMKTLINSGQQNVTSGYIQELETQMDNKIKIIHTEHPVLSALLTEQMQRARKAGIPFELDVRLESGIKIEPVDLCIILGNLYDNAFEACASALQAEQAFIRASIAQRGNAIAIKIENTYNPTMKSKRRTGKHGLGLKNVHQAVKKYNGNVSILENNGIFQVSIVVT